MNDYAAKHPGGPQEQRPLAEQVEIQQLTSAVTQAQSQYTTAQQKSEEARLATEQATTNASQRLRIIDQPKADPVPLSGLKKSVMTLVIFVFVGLLLSFAAVVLGTVLDRSLRTADDVEALLHLPVLAVVPDVRRSRCRPSGQRRRPVKADPAARPRPKPRAPTAPMGGSRSCLPTSPRAGSCPGGAEKVSTTSGRRTRIHVGGRATTWMASTITRPHSTRLPGRRP